MSATVSTSRRRGALARTAIAATLGAALLLQSGAAAAIGLMQSYQEALKADPTFQAAFFDSEAGKEYRVLGRAGLLPVVQGSYNNSKNVTDITSHDSLGRESLIHPKYNSHSAVVQLRQTLFNFDAWSRYKQGQAQSDYSVAKFDSERQALVLRVIGAYCDALYADDQLALAQAQRDTYAEQRKVNDRLFEKGEGTRTDMLETQSKLDLAEAQVLEARDYQFDTRATLAGIIGAEVTALDGLSPQFRIMPLSGGLDEWKKMALANNPDVQAQTLAIEAARQEINKGRAGHLPRLDFVASYEKNSSETINTYNQDSTVRALGLQLTVPLYSGGAVSSQTRQAAAGYGKAMAERDVTTDKTLIEVRKQYNVVVSSVAKIDALVKAVESSQLLMTATKKSILGGVRINLDLLNAQQQLYTSQRDLAQARYNYLIGTVRLRAAAGILSVDDVREIAGYFR